MHDLQKSLLEMAKFSPSAMHFPYGWCGHLPFAAWLIRVLAPKIFVELGTHSGNSYFAFCQSVLEACAPTRCFAVDTWQGDEHAGNYDNEIFQQVSTHNQTHYAAFSGLLRMTFDEAAAYFSDNSIELLHIDGLHTYEAVRHDFETWRPKLAPGALVLFHDTNVRERGFGVWRLWEELCRANPEHLEFTHSHGLGVVRLNGVSCPPHLQWLVPHSPEQRFVKEHFSILGAHQMERAETIRLRDVVSDRESQIAVLHRTVEELRSEIFTRDSMVVERDKTLVERDEQILTLYHVIAERENHILWLTSSRSWRMTRPLRISMRVLRALRARPGLPLSLCGALRSKIRQHGWAGFSRRVPFYLRNTKTYLRQFTATSLAADVDQFNAAPPLLREIRLHPDLTTPHDTIDARISVVIPTFNAGSEFSRLLRKLRAQRGVREIEIVVVDSGSTDDTSALARDAGCVVVEISQAEFSHSFARNLGAQNASGEYLLFMVQDAYPIGDYWAYGMLRFLLDHAEDKLAATSCAEYSRSDSDVMYDSLINTHYRFLGCLDHDRIGEYRGQDHLSLRAHGQLSDVSCLISAPIFAQYRYQGDYAEDLDLGIRLIRGGYRVAMLASVKTVHSHNRPAWYYLKRSFVDVVFLVGMFSDFTYPHIQSPAGLLAGIVSVAAHLSDWLPEFDRTAPSCGLHEELDACIRRWRKTGLALRVGDAMRLNDSLLDDYLAGLVRRFSPTSRTHDSNAKDEAQRFQDAFLARLEHFNAFAREVYEDQDASLRTELREAVIKTFCAAAGSALGFVYMDRERLNDDDKRMAETVYHELKAGI